MALEYAYQELIQEEVSMPIIIKYLISAAVVVAISEIAKRSDKIGALIAALPIVTVLAMTWMFSKLKVKSRPRK